MGGWMPYQRMRNRNQLMFRTKWLYPTHQEAKDHFQDGRWSGLVGDLNRMEEDYLDPQYPEPPLASRAPGSDPSTECAQATGIDVETVRKVLRYVFLEQG